MKLDPSMAANSFPRQHSSSQIEPEVPHSYPFRNPTPTPPTPSPRPQSVYAPPPHPPPWITQQIATSPAESKVADRTPAAQSQYAPPAHPPPWVTQKKANSSVDKVVSPTSPDLPSQSSLPARSPMGIVMLASDHDKKSPHTLVRPAQNSPPQSPPLVASPIAMVSPYFGQQLQLPAAAPYSQHPLPYSQTYPQTYPQPVAQPPRSSSLMTQPIVMVLPVASPDPGQKFYRPAPVSPPLNSLPPRSASLMPQPIVTAATPVSPDKQALSSPPPSPSHYAPPSHPPPWMAQPTATINQEIAGITQNVSTGDQRDRNQEELDAALARRLQIQEAASQLPATTLTNLNKVTPLVQQLSDAELARRMQEDESLGNRFLDVEERPRSIVVSESSSDAVIARMLAEMDGARPANSSEESRTNGGQSLAPIAEPAASPPEVALPPDTSGDEAFARSLIEQERTRAAATPTPAALRRQQEIMEGLPVYEEVPTKGTTLPVPTVIRPRVSREFRSTENGSSSDMGTDISENPSLAKLGPPVPAGISRLIYVSLSKDSKVICFPAGAVLYSAQFKTNPWKATITRGSEYLMSADKPYNRGFRLIMDTITIPIEPTTATITTKYAFKFRKVEYKWRMASFSDAIATITTSNGPYRPHSKAIGTNGTIILQQMPTKNVCAIYMRSTGVIDFASEAFDDAELRDVIIGSLFPVIEFGRASSL